jgi:putative ABC transport system substrate-binding protein
MIENSSFPGLTRQTNARRKSLRKKMDARVIGERSDAVLRTAMPAHDKSIANHTGIRRRAVLSLLAGAAAWPLAARAQQSAMPVVGFLGVTSPETNAALWRGFHQGLKETGHVEGDNVLITYRWAENKPEQLPELAGDLVRRGVAVIAAIQGPVVVLAARSATQTIPIAFTVADDPVKLGLVASLARPGGNLTGINFISAELTAKRLELLRQIVPEAKRLAVLVNPTASLTQTEAALRDVAAHAAGLQIQVLNANTTSEIDAAFATFARERPDALFVASSPYFANRRVQLVQLAARHAVAATYVGRQFPEIGGLMSYGADLRDAFRQLGVYVGRILKGAKPADLPVVQATKFELVINHQTARMLGLAIPPSLLAIADEVIE